MIGIASWRKALAARRPLAERLCSAHGHFPILEDAHRQEYLLGHREVHARQKKAWFLGVTQSPKQDSQL